MATNAVPGFLPSLHGFRFANRWPPGPVRVFRLGPLRIPFANVGRGLCGGMVYAARDRFDQGTQAPADGTAPPPESALFAEIVDRQLASFGLLLVAVPLRFWLAAGLGQRSRDRETATDAWPSIRAAIDDGRPPMIGLVRLSTWNPLAPLGHQVVGFRYAESEDRVSIGVYDPNHPGDDGVELALERSADGALGLSQSTGEPVLGLLALPYRSPVPARSG